MEWRQSKDGIHKGGLNNEHTNYITKGIDR